MTMVAMYLNDKFYTPYSPPESLGTRLHSILTLTPYNVDELTRKFYCGCGLMGSGEKIASL